MFTEEQMRFHCDGLKLNLPDFSWGECKPDCFGNAKRLVLPPRMPVTSQLEPFLGKFSVVSADGYWSWFFREYPSVSIKRAASWISIENDDNSSALTLCTGEGWSGLALYTRALFDQVSDRSLHHRTASQCHMSGCTAGVDINVTTTDISWQPDQTLRIEKNFYRKMSKDAYPDRIEILTLKRPDS